MSRRVFLITSIQMKVFEWHGKRLFASCEFKNSDEGGKAFADYIRSTAPKTSQILVELLEEDFQQDKIPHLHGNDKSAVIKRAISKNYGTNQFTHAQIVGRDKVGRRDDEILLASISNSEPLDYWLEQFEIFSVPISGIWSLPMLSQDLLKVLKKKLNQKDENILLISRQMRSTIRESFFRKDKLLLSRQVKIDRELRRANGLEAYLTHGAEQIHKFLTNQRIMQYGAQIAIYSLLPKRLIDETKFLDSDSEVLKHYYFDLDDLSKQFGLQVDGDLEADIFFSYLCSLRSVTSDHYGTRTQKLSYKKYLLDRSVFLFTVVASLFLLAGGGVLAVTAYDIDKKRQSIDGSVSRLQQYYNENLSARENDIESAQRIKKLVDFQKLLSRESSISPEKFLASLSKVYSLATFSSVSIDAMHWDKMYGTDLDQEKESSGSVASPPADDQSQDYLYEEDSGISKKIGVVRLFGKVNRSTKNYSQTVEKINSFAEHLRNIPEVDTLHLIKIPVDTRKYSSFADQGGITYLVSQKTSDIDAYEIVLFLADANSSSPIDEASSERADEMIANREAKDG